MQRSSKRGSPALSRSGDGLSEESTEGALRVGVGLQCHICDRAVPSLRASPHISHLQASPSPTAPAHGQHRRQDARLRHCPPRRGRPRSYRCRSPSGCRAPQRSGHLLPRSTDSAAAPTRRGQSVRCPHPPGSAVAPPAGQAPQGIVRPRRPPDLRLPRQRPRASPLLLAVRQSQRSSQRPHRSLVCRSPSSLFHPLAR